MVVKRRKKITKMRGSRTHGWGLVHRNSGQRGGAGNAGRGKKAHSNKPTNWQDKSNPKYFGKHGFKHKGPLQNDTIIDIKTIEQQLPKWLAQKEATQQGVTFDINLEKLGYTKLLSTGKPTKKFKLTIKTATQNATQKINSAGGEIILPAKKTQPKKNTPVKSNSKETVKTQVKQ